MRVLVLDTSSPAVTAGVAQVRGDGVEVVAEHVQVDARRHGELLAQGVREVLGGSRPDAVVVGTGPGPFTGLRVGLMTAAAMADAHVIPAYGVCSLDGIALDDCVVVTDARRKEVYWARYEAGVRVEGPEVERPGDLVPRLAAGALLVGAGAVLHRDLLAGFSVDADRLHPTVGGLVAGALPRLVQGAASDPLTPLYLRRPDAVEPGAIKRVTA